MGGQNWPLGKGRIIVTTVISFLISVIGGQVAETLIMV